MNDFDLVIKNGDIITMDKTLSKKRWIAVKNGVISALGEKDDFSGNAKEFVDLGSRTLMPGLIDAHIHSTMTGLGQTGVNLSGIDTISGVLGAIRDFCANDPSDKIICAFNMQLPIYMADKRVPTKDELDAVTGSHPVIVLFWTVHGGVMNSKAIKEAKLEGDLAYIKKDGYFDDCKTSGAIIGNVFNLFTDDDLKGVYKSIAEQCVKRGITTINTLDGMWVKDDRDVDILLKIKDSLPVEFIPYTQTFNWQKVAHYGLKQVGGCICLDGPPKLLAAAYSEPYRSAPHTRGFLIYTDQELYTFVTAATKAGIQVAFHAIGDRAIDQIIHIYQQVDRETGIKHLRHRIEHFSLPTERTLEMAVEMNIAAICQPAISDMLDGPNGNRFEFQVSDEKAQIHENFTVHLNAGVMVAGGSDAPVTPIDSFFGINAAVNAYNPNRRTTLDNAIKLFTVNAAWACHQENRLGSLEAGKDADFIIIDKNPYSMANGENISEIKVETTYKKGRIVYQNLSEK